MCGIAGLFNYASSLSERGTAETIVQRMTDSLVHRGPDAQGIWADSYHRCILGHRRLSIIDTSDAGRQPMMSADSRWVIVFNGEIYNFLDVKPLLETRGVQLRGRTDTEVLLESIAMWGIDALPKLDGMFAFAAFDTVSGELILARDAFGEKPLYYVELPGGGLAFASELQALEKLPDLDAEVSLDAMAEVLMFQYIGAPRTIYRSVKKLLPGHWMLAFADQPSRAGRFFEFQPGAVGFDQRPLSTLADELEDILLRSIRRRLIADVPLGAFLSGGVDSSTVCALIRKNLSLPLKTFSIGFRHAPESEHKAAREFARHIGSDHHDQILSPDTSDFLLNIGRMLDEPNGDSSCMPTFLLSQFARRQVTVAISGDGGDEMFAGYGRYFHTLEDERSGRHSQNWHPGEAYYSERILVSTERYIEELFGVVPDGLRRHLGRLRAELGDTSIPLFCHLRKTDVKNYMPGAVLSKVDRMSMQHSLELRTPFLNVELARFAEKLPLDALYHNALGKRLLREVAYRYLPQNLVDAPKKGFGIPMSTWGRDALLGVASRLLEQEDSRLGEALGMDAIGRFLARQRSKNGFSTYQVWSLAMLESWLRYHPAKLQEVSQALQRSRSKVSKLGVGAPEDMVAWPIGDNEYRVLDEVCSNSQRGRTAVAQDDLIDGQPVRLPPWGESPRADEVGQLLALRGAKLVFNDLNHSRRIDRKELEKYSALGVVEVEYPHPHFSGTFVRIRIQNKTLFQRIAAALFLRRWAVAKLGWGERMTLVKQAIRGQLPDGLLLSFGPLQKAQCERDKEMSHRFVLFEGLNQLAPIPVSHTEISEAGGGRYSVWNGFTYFSATRLRRLLTHSYWLVKNTPRTERYLQYVCDIVRKNQLTPWTLAEALERRLETGTSAPAVAASAFDGPIVLFTHGLPPGGAEKQWCYLAAGLKGRKEDVVFVSQYDLAGANGHYRPFLEQQAIQTIELSKLSVLDVLRRNLIPREFVDILLRGGSPWPTREFLCLAGILRKLKARAIVAQLDYPNLLAATAGLLVGTPKIILSFRNYNPSNFSYLRNDWYQRYYRAIVSSPSVVLTGNSRDANVDYASWIGVAADHVHWIPNAIHPDSIQTPSLETIGQLRRELDIQATAPMVLGVFRLSEEKRPLLFLEVCARVSREIPGIRVVMVGVGRMQQKVEERIVELGLGKVVTMLGRRSDISPLMACASLLLLTSSFEGMPNVVMEAQLLGLPVVATRVGGVPDCIEDGHTGLLLPSDDVEGLARACIRVLRSPALRHEMGSAAISRMTSMFSCDAMVSRYLKLID